MINLGIILNTKVFRWLIKIILDNTKMDDTSKKELNQKFNELNSMKEDKTKLIENENKLN